MCVCACACACACACDFHVKLVRVHSAHIGEAAENLGACTFFNKSNNNKFSPNNALLVYLVI